MYWFNGWKFHPVQTMMMFNVNWVWSTTAERIETDEPSAVACVRVCVCVCRRTMRKGCRRCHFAHQQSNANVFECILRVKQPPVCHHYTSVERSHRPLWFNRWYARSCVCAWVPNCIRASFTFATNHKKKERKSRIVYASEAVCVQRQTTNTNTNASRAERRRRGRKLYRCRWFSSRLNFLFFILCRCSYSRFVFVWPPGAVVWVSGKYNEV